MCSARHNTTDCVSLKDPSPTCKSRSGVLDASQIFVYPNIWTIVLVSCTQQHLNLLVASIRVSKKGSCGIRFGYFSMVGFVWHLYITLWTIGAFLVCGHGFNKGCWIHLLNGLSSLKKKSYTCVIKIYIPDRTSAKVVSQWGLYLLSLLWSASDHCSQSVASAVICCSLDITKCKPCVGYQVGQPWTKQ